MIFGNLFSLAQQPAAGQAPGPNMLTGLLPIIVIFGIFYVILIMPQRKKQKKHMQMVENLKPGDRIITTAGIFGTVMGVQKDRIELKIAANVKIDVTKSAVGVILGATDTLPEKTT
jgi:preprotein translocase subunit YajC